MKTYFKTNLKRSISFFVVIIMVLLTVPISAFAVSNDTVDLYFEPTSLQPAYKNAIFINGTFYDYINESTAQTIKIPRARFHNGENNITFICGSSQTGTYYDETVAPNTRNHNDPKIKNIQLTVDGSNNIPTTVVGHYITDPTIPAIDSSRTDSVVYQPDTNYTFGDGAPGGSPHPASLTIPYKIDFNFQLEGIEQDTDVSPYDINLEEGQIYNNTVTVTTSAANNSENLQLFVDNTEIQSKGTGEVSFRYLSNGIQADDNQFKNGFFINGSLVDYLNENISEIAIDEGKINYNSENTISLMIGNEKGPYDENLAPEKANYDDFTVKTFDLILPDGTVLTPTKIKTYRAENSKIPASQKNIVEEEEYSSTKTYKMGDGFPGGSDLSQYYKIDIIYNVPQQNKLVKYFSLDTTKFSDGLHTVSVKADQIEKNSVSVKFDNTAPAISLSFTDGETIGDGSQLTSSITDEIAGVSTISYRLNGEEISFPYTATIEKLGTGLQILTVLAEDKLGNSIEKTFSFHLDSSLPTYTDQTTTTKDGKTTFSVTTGSNSNGSLTVDFYQADPLSVTSYTGISSNTNINQIDLSSGMLVTPEESQFLSTKTSEGLPYQSYIIDTQGKSGTMNIHFTAKTLTGETLALQLYNPATDSWDMIQKQTSKGQELEFSCKIKLEDYAKNNQVKAVVAPFLVSNESDTIAWISDTQYYTQREELKEQKIYEKMLTWLKQQYLDSNIGYVAHTGDIVETSSSEEQYIFASKAQNILDEANIPNGLVSGNHDVGADIENLNYNLYKKYFGASRYKGKDWYGGEFDNNTNHYDLVTIGGQDMIILYLGMGQEATPETIMWANNVLSTYSHRTAIIALHEYLNPQGSYITYARGEQVFHNIIVPNDNVAMVICGHDPGASRNIRQVPDSDRKIIEILSDYQAEQNGGDGFLRLLQFTDGKLVNKTYSPVTDTYNCFSPEVDEFTVDIHMAQNLRIIETKGFTASICGDKDVPFSSTSVDSGSIASTTLDNKNINFTGWYAVITDDNGNRIQTPVMSFQIDSEQTTSQQPSRDQSIDKNHNTPTDSNYPITGDKGFILILVLLCISASTYIIIKKQKTY